MINEENKYEQLDNVKKKHTCGVICPSVEYLEKTEIITNVVCTVIGCDEVFSQISALNLHLEKVHKIFNKVISILLFLWEKKKTLYFSYF